MTPDDRFIPTSQRELVTLSLILRPVPRRPKARLVRRDRWAWDRTTFRSRLSAKARRDSDR